MDDDTRNSITVLAHTSHAGLADFGEHVGALAGLGVTSYFVDYRARRTTYYLDGPAEDCVAIPLPAPDVPIPGEFDAQAMREAICGAQAGQVRYPEFMTLSMAAGCVGYIVWIGGRHVSYFGRDGQTHVEHFPPAS